MRFKEFKNQTDEAIGPAIAQGARSVGGVLAKGAQAVGNAAVSGAKALGNAALQGAKTVGGQAANTVGQAVAGTVQGAAQGAVQGQQAEQPQIVLKPGMNISTPGLGQTKIKTMIGKNAVLDTQKTLGLDVTVDQAQLAATLGQNQQAGKPGIIKKAVGAIQGAAQGLTR
jgi:hypothetical protein